MSIKYERARKRAHTLIVAATVELLQEIGYEKLNVTRIAERADIGRGTFYRYFNDVDAVIMAIFEFHIGRLYAVVDEILLTYESPTREKIAWQAAFQYLEKLFPIVSQLRGTRTTGLWEQIATYGLHMFTLSLSQRDILYTQNMDLPLDVLAHFTSGALSSLVRGWFSGTLNYSAEEMGTMVFKLLYPQAE